MARYLLIYEKAKKLGLTMNLKNIFTLIFLFIWQDIVAQNITITYLKTIDLKSEVEKLTGNGNDWETVLYYNGFMNINSVSDGARLKIPVNDLKKINALMEESSSIIEKATKEGSRIFSPETLDKTIKLIDDIKISLKSGKLNDAIQSGTEAKRLAELTYYTTLSLRRAKTTAKLIYFAGTTEYRIPEDYIWNKVKLFQEFKEKDRVRTLSESEADILFKDESQIHMSENSLTVIEQLGIDKLENTQNTRITILRGDFLAYLNRTNERNIFNITTPGVETEINSENFLTSLDIKETARFSNYAGRINVKASGKSVTIKKNQGSVIEKNKAPSDPINLLPQPEIVEPLTNKIIYGNSVDIKWEDIPDAIGYRIDISENSRFTSGLKTQNLGKTNLYKLKTEKSSIYYFRISGIDKNQLVGPASEPLSLLFKPERVAPYLFVEPDKTDKITISDSVTFKGYVDKNSSLMANNREIPFNPDGSFLYKFPLSLGKNIFTFTAQYPSGLSSEKNFIIERISKSRLISIQDSIYSINTPIFYLKGKNLLQKFLTINNNSFESDSSGYFFSKINLTNDKKVEILVKNDGYSFSKDVYVSLDTIKPVIKPDSLPDFTFEPTIKIKGEISEPCNVWINENLVKMENNNFIFHVQLKPGWNEIEIIARDFANNIQISNIYIEYIPKPNIISVSILPTNGITGGSVIIDVIVNDPYQILPKSGKVILYNLKGSAIGNGAVYRYSKGKYNCSIVLSQSSQKFFPKIEFRVKDKIIVNK